MAIDLASGLADHITVSGISLGGVLAVWAAQYRHIAVAAPIAPAIVQVPSDAPDQGDDLRHDASATKSLRVGPACERQARGTTVRLSRFSTHRATRSWAGLLKAARMMPLKADSV